MAKELRCLEVIISDTITGYDGDMTLHEWGYGNPPNPATNLRVKGFEETKQNNWI